MISPFHKELSLLKTLKFLSDKRFSSARDTLKEYSGRSMIYYKQLDDRMYLVMNHFNFNRRKELQGFDVWLSQYDRASEIGAKRALSIKNVKIAFHFPEDLPLLSNYI